MLIVVLSCWITAIYCWFYIALEQLKPRGTKLLNRLLNLGLSVIKFFCCVAVWLVCCLYLMSVCFHCVMVVVKNLVLFDFVHSEFS